MKSKTIKMLNSLHRKQVLVASIPAIDDACLAWVGVHPLDPSVNTTRWFLKNHNITFNPTDNLYRIRIFEVSKLLIEQDVWVCEKDLKNRLDVTVCSDEELISVLGNIGISLEQLEYTWESNYPI